MITFGPIWSCVVLHDQVWSCLIMYGHVWSQINIWRLVALFVSLGLLCLPLFNSRNFCTNLCLLFVNLKMKMGSYILVIIHGCAGGYSDFENILFSLEPFKTFDKIRKNSKIQQNFHRELSESLRFSSMFRWGTLSSFDPGQKCSSNFKNPLEREPI